MELERSIRAVQDIMRQDVGVDGDAQRLGQLAWLLFLKILDDHEHALEVDDPDYESPIPDHLRWRSWASRRPDLSGDDLIAFVDNTLFPELRQLPDGQSGKGAVVRELFQDAYNYMRSGALLRQILDRLDELLDLRHIKDRHFFGDVYESLLKDLQSAGNAGEYYTVRPLTDFIIEAVDPKLGESVLDFACGTGGFLISALSHVRSHYVKTKDDDRVLQNSLRGVEKKPLPHMLCVTNMLLHGLEVPDQICRGNMLNRPLSQYGERDRVDVIATNPPFGGYEEDGIEAFFPQSLRSRETADLFLVLMVHLLRDGGRGAIILPDGALFGGGVKTRIRQRLLETCNVHTILRLPPGVFAPYTGIKTNVLFFTKGQATEQVWYYEHPLPEGIRAYSKRKPLSPHELDSERAWWNDRREGPHAWCVPISTIRGRDYSLDFRNPHRHSTSASVRPSRLVQQVRSADGDLKSVLSHVREHLEQSLAPSRKRKASTLLRNLDVVATSVHGVDYLRDYVLCEAFSGGLTTSSPTGNIDDVFARLAERRGTLAHAQPRSRSSIIPGLNGDLVLPRAPRRWACAYMEDIARIVSGATPKSTDESNFDENGIPWLTPADLYKIDGKYVSRGKRSLSKKGLASCSAKLLPKGTVLFSSRAPIGYVAIASNDLATNQGFKSCIPYIPEMSDFIYYFLLYSRKAIDENAPGTTFKEVSSKAMRSLNVVVPSLDEQAEMVRTIESIFDDLHLLERVLGKRREASERASKHIVSHAMR